MDESKVTEPKKKNPLQKLKENIDDKEEQLAILGNFVRLGVLIWSGFSCQHGSMWASFFDFWGFTGRLGGVLGAFGAFSKHLGGDLGSFLAV